MFCPRCSTKKAENGTQYCTNCGLDVSELDDYLKRAGNGTKRTDRERGIQQGVKLILMGFVLIPVWLFIGQMFPPNDRFVESSPSTTWLEQLFWILMWISFLAGAARLIYALAFSQNAAMKKTEKNGEIPASEQRHSLPSGDKFKPAEPGRWRSTGELFERVVSRPRNSGELG